MNKTTTQTDYAAHAGVSVQAVSKWIRTGKLPESCLVMEKCSDGRTRKMIIVTLADKARAENLDHTKNRQTKAGGRKPGGKPKRGPAVKVQVEEAKKAVETADTKAVEFDVDRPGGITLADAQKQKEIYRAGILKLAYLKEKGILCNVADRDRKVLELHRQVKTDLQSLCRKSHLMAELVSINDVETMENRVGEIIRDLMSELSKEIERIEKEQGL